MLVAMSSPASSRPRSLNNLTDTQWLQSLAASIRSPAEWQAALRLGDIRLVSKQLRRRFSTFKKLGLIPALRWSADSTTDAVTIDAIDELSRLASRKGRPAAEMLSGMVEAWLDRQPPAGIPSVLDQLLACAILIDRSARLSDGVLVRLWRFIEDHTGQITGSPGTHHPAIRELLTTEMQLLRLISSAELPLKKSDVEPVVLAVHQFLGTFTDEDGSPLATIHSSLAAALAVLARLADVFERIDFKLVDTPDRKRIEGLVARSILLFPLDCSWVPSRTPHEALDWLQRISGLVEPENSESTVRQLKLWKRISLESKPAGKKAHEKSRPRPLLKRKQLVSHQSDFSQYAILHGDWRDSRDRCITRFDEPVPTVEVSVLDQALIRGAWTASVTAGGQTWTSGAWSCCCWYSDSEADFCELKWEPAPGVTVFRQLLWSRVDHFLFVAEEVRAPGMTGISIESRLPIVAGWKALADGRSREWQLHHGDSVARVLPIFAAQERVQNSDCFLSCENNSILMRSSREQTSQYCAYVIDWSAQRREAPAHWGPLTVAEEGQRVPPQIACAARWRMGDRLWIVFHQAEKGDSSRTALGLHSPHETVIASVADGKYKSLVEVD